MKTSSNRRLSAETLRGTQRNINGTTEMDAKHDGLDNIKSISSDGMRRSGDRFLVRPGQKLF